MEIGTLLIDILKTRGIRSFQEYEVSMPIMELEAELTRHGFTADQIMPVLTELCSNGILAMDEVSVYLYESSS